VNPDPAQVIARARELVRRSQELLRDYETHVVKVAHENHGLVEAARDRVVVSRATLLLSDEAASPLRPPGPDRARAADRR
jgi:hypothetical protein